MKKIIVEIIAGHFSCSNYDIHFQLSPRLRELFFMHELNGQSGETNRNYDGPLL